MAKKLGKVVALAAVAGAAAAGITYLKKARALDEELGGATDGESMGEEATEEDFVEEEEKAEGKNKEADSPKTSRDRNYVSLKANKDEFLVAAGDMLNAAKDVAGAMKNVVWDAANIVADSTRDTVSAAKDTAAAAKASFLRATDKDKSEETNAQENGMDSTDPEGSGTKDTGMEEPGMEEPDAKTSDMDIDKGTDAPEAKEPSTIIEEADGEKDYTRERN